MGQLRLAEGMVETLKYVELRNLLYIPLDLGYFSALPCAEGQTVEGKDAFVKEYMAVVIAEVQRRIGETQ